MKKAFMILVFGWLFLAGNLIAQGSKDSLLNVIERTDLSDSNRIDTYLVLSDIYSYENLDTAKIYALKAKQLAEKIDNKKLIADALRELGWDNYAAGNYSEALQNYFKAYSIYEAIFPPYGGQDGAAVTGNVGTVYYSAGDYPKALDYYFKTLKFLSFSSGKSVEAETKIAAIYGNIGNVFKDQRNYEQSLNYYLKALKISEKLDNKSFTALVLGNIGIIYNEKREFAKALDYYFKALQMFEELHDKNGVATWMGNVGLVYMNQCLDLMQKKKNVDAEGMIFFNKSLDCFLKELKMAEELGSKTLICSTLGNIGSLYAKTHALQHKNGNALALAEDYLKKSLTIADSIGYMDATREFESTLSVVYSGMGKHQLALEHYKKYISARDSLFNEENTKKTVQTQMSFEFDKKRTEEKLVQERKDAISLAELKQQKLQRNYFIVGFSLMMLLVFFILRGYKQKQRANNLLAEKNTMIEIQKTLVEGKNKDIMDSIRYARRIQSSLLPSEKYIDKSMKRLKKLL